VNDPAQKVLANYGERIGRAADDIATNFPDPDLSAAAAKAFVAVVGSEIPDETLRTAVKRLAANNVRETWSRLSNGSNPVERDSRQ
jgi:hypothetical protein